MKIVSDGPRIDGEAMKGIRAGVEKVYDNHAWTWAEFQSALDAYRDAAYWAGYKDAKDELLRHYLTGETDIDFRKYGIKK